MSKKFLYMFLVFCMLPSIVCGAEYSEKQIKPCPEAKQKMCDLSGHPITGKVISHYPNGQVRGEIDIQNGEADGLLKEYDEKGNLRGESHIKNGNPEGLSKEYDENGNLVREINFKNGVPEGSWKEYDKNGNLKSEINI